MCTCTLPYSGAGPCRIIVRWEGLHAERSSNPIIETSDKSVRRPEAPTRAPGGGGSHLNPIVHCLELTTGAPTTRCIAYGYELHEIVGPLTGRIPWAVSTPRVSPTLDTPSKFHQRVSRVPRNGKNKVQAINAPPYQSSDTLLV